MDTTAAADELVERTRRVADHTGLDAARIASWCTARSLASGLWAADRGWWTGFRGADGDLRRATAWSRAAHVLGACSRRTNRTRETDQNVGRAHHIRWGLGRR